MLGNKNVEVLMTVLSCPFLYTQWNVVKEDPKLLWYILQYFSISYCIYLHMIHGCKSTIHNYTRTIQTKFYSVEDKQILKEKEYQ